MTKDDYLRIARESGMTTGLPMYDSVIVKFASAIAALEREECAKVCYEKMANHGDEYFQCAEAIRNKEGK
jgi:hypothetical protein